MRDDKLASLTCNTYPYPALFGYHESTRSAEDAHAVRDNGNGRAMKAVKSTKQALLDPFPCTPLCFGVVIVLFSVPFLVRRGSCEAKRTYVTPAVMPEGWAT